MLAVVKQIASSRLCVGSFWAILEFWQHAGEDLQPQVFLVAQAVGAALDDADLVVEALDEAERDLVLRVAVGGDAVPMALDHLGELLVRLEPLPLQACAPVVEEAPRPAFALVVPQLAEGLLEQVGLVQPLVGRQQRFNAFVPSSVRFSRCDSSVYFCPLMKRRSCP